jgi:hypothetical protein
MVPNPRHALQHGGDPRQRPQIGGKPMGERATPQRHVEVGPLRCIQGRLAA